MSEQSTKKDGPHCAGCCHRADAHTEDGCVCGCGFTNAFLLAAQREARA